ncbi:hypothetical protein SAY87_000820 [Trapa incisa]|uniref:BRCT domain-containing protein n=1 Tax=Trapa incisa TaxID=236973 RepID=A0AAN7GJH5_9MYRT|nr:hypothetical protein SAY87_000820 [Trapa incisa]
MLEPSPPSKTFVGVSFFLVGFDPDTHRKIRAKLVNSSGVEVGHYGPNCTHLIVGRVVYDDPMCVTAREDGKVVVTGLWVDHSYEVGMPVDTSSIMYQPVRDLNGIPGAKSLVMCLTGYQRHDREDIMMMVSFMGAQFSKPLVANKVTHLICYKFEGEKYELAKKMKRINLVNHRWLEDCLRDWEILPEANYSKSTYELEMIEAEAKDSEEEDEFKFIEPRENIIKRSPLMQKVGIGTTALPSPDNAGALQHTPTIPCAELKSTPIKEIRESSGANDINSQQKHVGLCMGNPKASTLNIPDGSAQRTYPPAILQEEVTASITPEETSHTNAKFSFLSYSRKGLRRMSLEKQDGVALREGHSSKIQPGKVDSSIDNLSMKLEIAQDVIASDNIHMPSTVGDVSAGGSKDRSLEKRKLEGSSIHSKSQKINLHTNPSALGTSVAINRSPESNISGLMAQPLSTTYNSCLVQEALCPIKVTDCDAVGMDAPFYSDLDFMSSGGRQGVSDLTSKASVLWTDREKDVPAVFEALPELGKPDAAACQIDDATKDTIKRQDLEVPSLRSLGGEISLFHTNGSLDMLDRENDKADDQTKKMVVARKKTLGSRPKVSKYSNLKGSIYLKDSSLHKSTNCPLDREVSNIPDNLSNIYDDKAFSPEGDVEPLETVGCMDDETKLPYEGNNVVENTSDRKTFERVEMDATADPDEEKESAHDACSISRPGMCDDDAGRKYEHELVSEVQNLKGKSTRGRTSLVDEKQKLISAAKGADCDGSEMEGQKRPKLHGKAKGASMLEISPEVEETGEKDATADAEEENESLHEASNICRSGLYEDAKIDDIGTKIEQGEALSNVKSIKGKSTRGRKTSLANKKLKVISAAKEVDCGGSEMEGQKRPKMHGKAKSVSKPEISLEAEKENVVIANGNPCVSQGKLLSKKSSLNSKKKATNMTESRETNGCSNKGVDRRIEPAWFILSGHSHRQCRKEFQQVIRRLKGRFCRDSKQWSYQATHFIVPEPLRRTEKFFAAAASGRWILRTDYLSASNQAGKFLDEEPYEWHGNGLSEDGTINLEAPRKWRFLRERTGHGALYDVRIIIYGECIAPSLDTLKRVVKAGDGMILATSPPYNRFISKGVDFAVVSPGITRADVWVQEFLRHEVPCVVADYLVDYVCKPGYPLEKHVLYNTQAWAEKSLSRLQKKAKEIMAPEILDNNSGGDLSCIVCGSTDRGDVMLICGDESGCVGCGIGAHIDCCDPPLEAVPEEDWFCPSCSKRWNSSGSTVKRKRGRSVMSKQ